MSNASRRVVVTGIGAISPLGNNIASSFFNLFPPYIDNKHDDIGITTLKRAIIAQNLPEKVLNQELRLIESLPAKCASPVRGVEYDRRTSRFVQFALSAGMEAAKNANLTDWLAVDGEAPALTQSQTEMIQCRRDRAGVSLGVGMSSLRDIVTSAQSNRISRISPHFVPKILPNSAPSRLSLDLKLQGPNHVISTACAASAHAIIDGMRCIQMGDADIMLVGGSEATIDPISVAGFCRLRALSTTLSPDFDPLLSSRPFDVTRDGFVMGEGAAVFVLEELSHALKRLEKEGTNKFSILCELIGYGTTGDAYHITAPDKDGRGAQRAMTKALERASINSGIEYSRIRDSVQYINAHATATPVGDVIEAEAIDRTFLNNEMYREQELYVSSTKGSTGHLLGAAGALEAAYTIMTIKEGIIPPTRNLDLERTSDGEYSDCCAVKFSHVTTGNNGNSAKEKRNINIAMSNSFGFGGTNASLIFSKYCDDDKNN